MNTIQQNIDKLLKSGLPIDQFFNVTIMEFKIQLMGNNKTGLLLLCKNLGYEFTWDDNNNWLNSEKDGIRITITLN